MAQVVKVTYVDEHGDLKAHEAVTESNRDLLGYAKEICREGLIITTKAGNSSKVLSAFYYPPHMIRKVAIK